MQRLAGRLLGHSGMESLMSRVALSADKLRCADAVLLRQLDVVDAMLHCQLDRVGYPDLGSSPPVSGAAGAAGGCGVQGLQALCAAQCWMWGLNRSSTWACAPGCR